jgi:hypothetical protein
MPKEVPLQADMFTGELVDNRTRSQKKWAEEQAQPRQAEMFSQRELAQFGVEARPKLPISPKTRIELAMEDRRTEEEKERELLREIAERTYPMPGISSPVEAAGELE